MEHEHEIEETQELKLSELPGVGGGADYSYAYAVIGEIRQKFVMLINSGVSPEEARKIVKEKYWNKVLEVCRQHPDSCGIQKQAQIIFMFVVGS